MIKARVASLSNGQVLRNGRPISKTNVRSPYPFLLSENSVPILLLSFQPAPCHFNPPFVISTRPLSFRPAPCHFDPWEKSRPSEPRNNTFHQAETRISKAETNSNDQMTNSKTGFRWMRRVWPFETVLMTVLRWLG